MPKDDGIGASTKRREDIRFLTGKGRYTADINLRDQAIAVFVRSEVAHGRINSIDTSAALAMPGVLTIMTGADFASTGGNPAGWYIPSRDGSAMKEPKRPVLAHGKVRHVGLSNETPYGVHEFVRLAEAHGLPRVATVQNPYCLINRTYENALDETCHRLNVSLLAYSPLAFGLLTGKYDAGGLEGPQAPQGADGGRMSSYESMRKQRWGRPEALAAARRYNALAREHGLTPTQMALAFCYTKWQVASTIIGVTSLAQLDADLQAWGTTLSPELLAAIDAIRWDVRDPAL